MGLIKEPLDVDIEVEPRPLAKNEQNAISDFKKAERLKKKYYASK